MAQILANGLTSDGRTWNAAGVASDGQGWFANGFVPDPVAPGAATGDVTVTAASVRPLDGCLVSAMRAGVTIAAGQAVALGSDGRLVLADADLAQEIQGIAVAGAFAGQPCPIAVRGPLMIGAGLVVGMPYVVSQNPGAIAPIADGDAGEFLTQLGVASSSSVLVLDIQPARAALGAAIT